MLQWTWDTEEHQEQEELADRKVGKPADEESQEKDPASNLEPVLEEAADENEPPRTPSGNRQNAGGERAQGFPIWTPSPPTQPAD